MIIKYVTYSFVLGIMCPVNLNYSQLVSVRIGTLQYFVPVKNVFPKQYFFANFFIIIKFTQNTNTHLYYFNSLTVFGLLNQQSLQATLRTLKYQNKVRFEQFKIINILYFSGFVLSQDPQILGDNGLQNGYIILLKFRVKIIILKGTKVLW